MKFIMQSFFLLCIVFIGVLGGIQIANNDSGQDGYQQITAADTEANEKEEAVVEVLEKKEDTAEKEKQLQEMKHANTFSKIGERLAKFVEKTVEVAIEPTISKIEQVVTGDI